MRNLWLALLFTFVLFFGEARSQTETPTATPGPESLDKLAENFWAWRAKYAPFTGDDVPRMERPGGTRDWSLAKIDDRRKDLSEFEARWKKLDVTEWPVPKQVDYRLIGSALSRVHWELEINPRWVRDPIFYIEQTLTPVVEALTVPGPYNAAQSREILTRLENIPSILQQGEDNLENPPAPFATVAIEALEGVRERLQKMATPLLKSTMEPAGAERHGRESPRGLTSGDASQSIMSTRFTRACFSSPAARSARLRHSIFFSFTHFTSLRSSRRFCSSASGEVAIAIPRPGRSRFISRSGVSFSCLD